MGVPSSGSNPTSLTGNRAQAEMPRSHPAQKPPANAAPATTGPAKCHHCPRAPCPAPALPGQSGDTSPALPSAKWVARLRDREGDIWGGGCGGEVSKRLSNRCSWTLKHGCSLSGCQQQACLSRDLCPPMLLTSPGSILSPSLSPCFWRSSVALLPCHGDAASHPGCTQPSSFTI